MKHQSLIYNVKTLIISNKQSAITINLSHYIESI